MPATYMYETRIWSLPRQPKRAYPSEGTVRDLDVENYFFWCTAAIKKLHTCPLHYPHLISILSFKKYPLYQKK